MSAFYDNNITDVGRLLLAKIQSGAKFVPTKIVIGSGYMPQGKTTRTMTDVAEVVKELSLNKVQKTSDGSVIFGTSFNNEDIFEPFYYRELGLYAKGVYYNDDGEPSNETEEVLYSYGNAGDNAELIPAYSEGSITERQLDLIVYIGNDTEVVVNIESGMYVTMPVFTEQIEKINKEIITIKADFDGINDKIGITTDDEGTVSTGTVFGKLNSILLYLTVTLVEKLSKITEDISENKTSIGNAEDLSTSPTIFGKLAEIKETLTTKFNEVISKITDSISENKKVVGSPEDISTSPTIFGKLAEIKETLTTKFTDIISKITSVDSKIGTTTDTGGTSSAGGIFAKLNKLLTDWTTTRASRIDSIYTNTNTSTTSSSTGTLSQKLNYIRTLIGASSDSGTSSIFGKLNSIVVGSSEGNICYASDTEKKSISNSAVPSDATTSKTIATFIPDYSGSLRFYFYGSGRGDSTDLYITKVDKDITYNEYSQGKAEALAQWSVSSITSYARTGDIFVEKGKTYYIKVVSRYENRNPLISSIKLKYDILERNIKGVKSIVGVQRGTFKYTTSNKTGIFPINPVNPFKTIVIANIYGYDNGSFFISNYKLTHNTLTLTSNGSNPHDIDWQLIEFV